MVSPANRSKSPDKSEEALNKYERIDKPNMRKSSFNSNLKWTENYAKCNCNI